MIPIFIQYTKTRKLTSAVKSQDGAFLQELEEK